MALVTRKIREGLEATKIESFCTKGGTIIQTEPMLDYATRLKYLNTVIDLLGVSSSARAKQQASPQGQAGTVNVLSISERYASMSDEELSDALSRITSGLFASQPPVLPLTVKPDAINGKEAH